MKTKYGFPLKKAYTVREIAENLMVAQNVLGNYLYKKGMDAKLGRVYEGEVLVGILRDYMKEAYLRKEETRERARYLEKWLIGKEDVIEEIVEVVKIVKEVKEDKREREDEVVEVIEEVKEEMMGGAFNMLKEKRDYLLKAINGVSVISALIGIKMELGWVGVFSLGSITGLLLVYCLLLVQDKEVQKSKRDITVFFMLIVEGFWGIFHNKTFDIFNSPNAVFGQNTSLWTAVIIGLLSYGVLLVQTFNDRD